MHKNSFLVEEAILRDWVNDAAVNLSLPVLEGMKRGLVWWEWDDEREEGEEEEWNGRRADLAAGVVVDAGNFTRGNDDDEADAENLAMARRGLIISYVGRVMPRVLIFPLTCSREEDQET